MPCPKNWTDILQAPLYLINLDRCPERLEVSIQRIQDAGFTNIQRWKATDAMDEQELQKGWADLGNPKIDLRDTSFKKYKGAQGCAITHYRLWKHMIEQKIPYMVVMEDDIAFHKHWKVLSPIYYEVTAKNYDILHMGNYNENNMLLAPIIVTPVFCTHSYIITLEGARKLLSLCLKRAEGTFTIDNMLVYYMRKAVSTQGAFYPFRWYVWNGQLFPDEEYTVDNILSKRNTGLVFQDGNVGSDVLPLDGEWAPTFIPYVSNHSAPQQMPFSQPPSYSPMQGPSPLPFPSQSVPMNQFSQQNPHQQRGSSFPHSQDSPPLPFDYNHMSQRFPLQPPITTTPGLNIFQK